MRLIIVFIFIVSACSSHKECVPKPSFTVNEQLIERR
jgi:hypothetical protein